MEETEESLEKSLFNYVSFSLGLSKSIIKLLNSTVCPKSFDNLFAQFLVYLYKYFPLHFKNNLIYTCEKGHYFWVTL